MSKTFSDTLQEALESTKLQELLNTCTSLGAIAKELGYSTHGRNTSAISVFLRSNGLDFNKHTSKPIEYETRQCLHCGKDFQVSIHNKNTFKVRTCSHYCSANYSEYKLSRVANKIGSLATSYPLVAKRNNLTYCGICGESEVIDIHHIDEDRDNNDISNLVALCPNHHAYIHRGKGHLILDKLIEHLDTRVVVD